MNIEPLLKTKFQQVVDAIEQIHYEHRVSAGAMWGPLTEREAKGEYEQLLTALPQIPGLTDEERETLKNMISTRITNIPEVEEAKRAEYEAYETAKKTAFEEAKKRFAELSVFEQVRLKQEKKDPDQIDVDWLSPEEINQLYRKKI